MMIMAENDIVIPPSTDRPIYNWLPAPKRWVVLANTGHVVFQDACADIQKQGGLQALAAALHLDRSSPEIRSAEDGCLPKDAPAAKVAAVWNHLTVAQLNWVFGIDRNVAAASLERVYLDRTFPGIIKFTRRSRPSRRSSRGHADPARDQPLRSSATSTDVSAYSTTRTRPTCPDRHPQTVAGTWHECRSST